MTYVSGEVAVLLIGPPEIHLSLLGGVGHDVVGLIGGRRATRPVGHARLHLVDLDVRVPVVFNYVDESKGSYKKAKEI